VGGGPGDQDIMARNAEGGKTKGGENTDSRKKQRFREKTKKGLETSLGRGKELQAKGPNYGDK